MSTPTVIENRIELEPVTSDPFVADLDRADNGRPATVLPSPPRRRIYD